jgi:hypothetical protein
LPSFHADIEEDSIALPDLVREEGRELGWLGGPSWLSSDLGEVKLFWAE